MIKNSLLFSLIVMLLYGCNHNHNPSETKLLNFEYFTINVPKAWEQIKLRGEDSYVGSNQKRVRYFKFASIIK